MAIDNAIFLDLVRFGKRFFKMAMEKFWILLGNILKDPKIDTT